MRGARRLTTCVPKLPDKFQFVTVLPKGDNLLLHLCQRKMGAKIPRQSSPRFWLRPAAIQESERLLQNGAATKGSHPHLFFAPYSVSWQQPHEQSFEISFLARSADCTVVSIIKIIRNVNRKTKYISLCQKARKMAKKSLTKHTFSAII